MRFTRRRSDRPDPARRGRASGLEVLESRQLLSTSGSGVHPFSVYLPTDLNVQNPITHQPESLTFQQLIRDENPQSPLLSNQGKVVSGTDRQGDQWTITVHGPGSVIVTDATPNDGALDDNIDTIQLVGTSLQDTYVTGTVKASPLVPNPSSTVFFNKLIATSGVNSIQLNGFDLTQTVTPGTAPNNSNTGIFLYGGVKTLSFHDILAAIDTSPSNPTDPIDVVIGDPNTPLKVQPSIFFNSIQNTVFNSSSTTVPANTPQTTPTVNLTVNGQIANLSFTSAGQETISAADQYLFPIVATTGRTSVQAKGINNLHVAGSATNFTASRSSTPFQNSTSGLNHLGTATFGGNADALGLDVNGPIGKLRFERGLGNPTGTSGAATEFGTPAADLGYPAAGLVGGLVTAKRIGAVAAKEANEVLQTAQNPNFISTTSTGDPTYYTQPGNALTSAAIVSSGSIGKVRVRGNLQSSEIKTGFDYPSFYAGLEGTRSRSQIRNAQVNGSLVNGVVSSTYRPANSQYNSPTDQKGPGAIAGNQGAKYNVFFTGSVTPLLNRGAGFFARTKHGSLPSNPRPVRIDSVQVRS